MTAEPWCRVRVAGPDGRALATVTLVGSGPPALGAVDRVARLALLAGRLGGRAVVEAASPELRTLLALAALGVEVEGEPECGEQPLGLEERQEEIHPGDPAPHHLQHLDGPG